MVSFGYGEHIHFPLLPHVHPAKHTDFNLTVPLRLTPGCIYLPPASYLTLTVFTIKHKPNHYRDMHTVTGEKKKKKYQDRKNEKDSRKRKRQGERRTEKSDTSDSTSQLVKEESEQAAKPLLLATACKVEILLFTFGQMWILLHCVCVCSHTQVKKFRFSTPTEVI